MTMQPDTTSYTDRDQPPSLEEQRAKVRTRRKKQMWLAFFLLVFGLVPFIILFGGMPW